MENLPAGDTVPVYVEIINSSTNQLEGYTGQTLCVGGTPPPPPPPSQEMVWELVPLPLPKIGISPSTYGVTQLQTWFWLDNDASGADAAVSLPGGVDGYTVSVTAHPVAYYWLFGDGSYVASTTNGAPGSAEAASATHTFTQKGTYPVGVIVAWSGTYTFSGYGVSETVQLGPVDQPEQVVQYPVQEIRSELRPS